jgi:hypothetical protein
VAVAMPFQASKIRRLQNELIVPNYRVAFI